MITQKDMRGASKQEIFNFVYAHLKEQGEQCRDGYCCKLRIKREGKVLACAIGCLIPDSHYKPEFEESSSFMYEYRQGEIHKYFSSDLHDFLYELQIIHDDSPNAALRSLYEKFCYERFCKVAVRHNLKMP